jgi:hypothetical protein
MYRNPLPSHRGRGKPQPEAEKVPQRWMQYEAAMGLVTVQIQGHCEKQNLHHRECKHGVAPNGELDQSIREMLWHELRLSSPKVPLPARIRGKRGRHPFMCDYGGPRRGPICALAHMGSVVVAELTTHGLASDQLTVVIRNCVR